MLSWYGINVQLKTRPLQAAEKLVTEGDAFLAAQLKFGVNTPANLR